MGQGETKHSLFKRVKKKCSFSGGYKIGREEESNHYQKSVKGQISKKTEKPVFSQGRTWVGRRDKKGRVLS